MKARWAINKGFTIVELLIVIVIIGILATITVVAYSNVQKNTTRSVLDNDLSNLNKSLAITSTFKHKISEETSLPESFKASKGVSVELIKNNLPRYSNINDVQRGVLFHDICGDLVAEGYGKGTNEGGGEEHYISACNVYNNNQIQVNGSWNGPSFSTPVSGDKLTEIADGISYNDSWRPNRESIEKLFYTTWHSRFLAQGGQYPVTSFWDPWASPGNGVMKDALPEPTAANEQDYCVQASSDRYPDMYRHSTNRKATSDGRCGA